jgi:hypothetical protein
VGFAQIALRISQIIQAHSASISDRDKVAKLLPMIGNVEIMLPVLDATPQNW